MGKKKIKRYWLVAVKVQDSTQIFQFPTKSAQKKFGQDMDRLGLDFICTVKPLEVGELAEMLQKGTKS
jgi:hypothetical protein